ncbi:hypothetical protein [Bordetella genomosp. 12]|uniref:hypothetical protein n=1 Tax=Bordetella genomosp. 12 TaxID=463035 RepID=UPI00268F9DE7
MNNAHSQQALESNLHQKYGPLLSLQQLAELLHRSADGLRVALRTSQPYALRICEARVKIGRRVYFRTTDIATYLCHAEAPQAASGALTPRQAGKTMRTGLEAPGAAV